MNIKELVESEKEAGMEIEEDHEIEGAYIASGWWKDTRLIGEASNFQMMSKLDALSIIRKIKKKSNNPTITYELLPYSYSTGREFWSIRIKTMGRTWTCDICGTENKDKGPNDDCELCGVHWTQDDAWYENVKLFRSVENKDNWKLPTRPIVCDTVEEAKTYLHAITFFTGGAEYKMTPNKKYIVTSKGYYHYVGA